LRRIVTGCADGSYGIEVAKLAGVPNSVVERAKVVLKELEGEGLKVPVRVNNDEPEMQMSFGSSNADDIVDKLKKIDVNTLTPIEAMSVLYDLTKQANN
ncbi:MAG: DNA mismatch repair protein MutS, partial [Clostridia bacterium]|nr:DNA mismatch repair protein MutS [Clostridia bacterium]